MIDTARIVKSLLPKKADTHFFKNARSIHPRKDLLECGWAGAVALTVSKPNQEYFVNSEIDKATIQFVRQLDPEFSKNAEGSK